MFYSLFSQFVLFMCVFFQPERINPESGLCGYDIKSDVWSLGISMVSNRLNHLFVMEFSYYVVFLKH